MTKKDKSLIWVYPPDKWVTGFSKTFVYGYSNPKAKLFVHVGADLCICPDIKQGKHIGLPVQIFPNGNFAKVINLPYKKNIIKLIQIFNSKKRVLTRIINIKPVGADLRVCPHVCHKEKKGEHTGSPLQNKNEMVIVIDPGHGGKEHGTHSPKGAPEKVFNLQVAKILVGALRATPLRGKIYLTRTKDKFVSLKNRVDFAKKKKANILISIHHNALPDNKDPLKHAGIGAYYTHNFSKPLAKKLLHYISKETGLKQYGTFKRNFALTRPNFCKAVLIECGFLTHPLEAEYVTQKSTQEKIVRGIVKGVIF